MCGAWFQGYVFEVTLDLATQDKWAQLSNDCKFCLFNLNCPVSLAAGVNGECDLRRFLKRARVRPRLHFAAQ